MIETRACAGARRHPLSSHLTKACTRQKSYVATDFSHDKPGGLGAQQNAHDARDHEVLVCDRASIPVIELSSSQKKKIDLGNWGFTAWPGNWSVTAWYESLGIQIPRAR